MKSLVVVDNYKTILKCQDTIQALLKDAEVRHVHIDQEVVDLVDMEKSRLNAERDLRKFLDHLDLTKCDAKYDSELGRLIAEAERVKVAPGYIDQAKVVKNKMSKTLDAGRILEDFLAYEPRGFEYPQYPKEDRKKKKWFGPDGKVVDMRKPWLINPIANKKEKKKWVIKQPAWYTQRQDIFKRIKTLNEYLSSPELQFDDEFKAKTKIELLRMNQENTLLERIELDHKLIEDAKPKPKKK